MAKTRTAKQKAALRKAQLASARKRKGKGRNAKVSRSFGSAYAAGLRLGLSKTHNKRAGLSQGRVTKRGQYDKRYQIRKNKARRALGFTAGVMLTTYGTSFAVAGAVTAASRRKRRSTR